MLCNAMHDFKKKSRICFSEKIYDKESINNTIMLSTMITNFNILGAAVELTIAYLNNTQVPEVVR